VEPLAYAVACNSAVCITTAKSLIAQALRYKKEGFRVRTHPVTGGGGGRVEWGKYQKERKIKM